MGTDKAFLHVAGLPIIERILGVLRRVADRIIVVTNAPDAYAAYDVEVITDALDKSGPLTGIYSGLCSSRDEYNVVVACDMPFLNPGLLSYMGGLAPDYDVVLPRIGAYCEPLHAVYRKRLLRVIETRIQQDDRRIQGLLPELRVRYVTEEEIDRFDSRRRSFVNLNTPQEYKEAVCSD